MAVTSLMTVLEDMEGAPVVIANNARYGSGQAGSTQSDIVPEGNQALGRRVDNATKKGIGVSIAAVDLSTAHVAIWVSVVQITLTTEIQVVIASGTGTNNVNYHTLPTDFYDPELRAIPVITSMQRTAEEGGGATLTGINEIGARASIGNVGGNVLNFIIDKISYGDGLEWAGAGGAFQDFIDYETANKEGTLVTVKNTTFANVRLRTGTASGDTFTDSDFELKFSDQPNVEADYMGLTIVGTTTLTNGTVSSTNIVAAQRRPDIIVGASGTLIATSISAAGARLVQLSGTSTWTGGVIDALELTQGGGTISDATIKPRSASGVAMIDDPDFTKLSGIKFEQAGLGHAIEITAPGTYGMNSLTWVGFGADGSNDAAIYNNSGGAVTLNISGGATPTVKNGGGASTILNNSVSVTLTDLDPGTKIRVFRQSDNAELAGVDSSGSTFVASLSAGVPVTFRMVSLFKRIAEFDLTVPGNDTTIPISQQTDRVFDNP